MKIEFFVLGIVAGTFIAMRLLVATIELEALKVLPTKESCIELIQTLD